MIKKIYAIPNMIEFPWGTDCEISAFANIEGVWTEIASHHSSNITWAKHHIGITSEWKHDIYNEIFPSGWEIEWLDYDENHPIIKELTE